MSQRFEIRVGDAAALLRAMPDESVQCVVTSPPYWHLRDYECNGQIGLEPTIEGYVEKLVGVFEQVRRVLRKDGTLWLNMGDSYVSNARAPRRQSQAITGNKARNGTGFQRPGVVSGLKNKDLVGQPWRIAFALQAAGWFLRRDIIWHKPAPLPESCIDRPTTAHEYLFLLSKRDRYYYDAAAIAEPVSCKAHSRGKGVNPKARRIPPGNWDMRVGGKHDSKRITREERDAIRAFNRRRKTDAHRDQAPTPLARADESQCRPSERFGRGKGWRHRQNESFAAAVRHPVQVRNRRSVWTIPPAPYRGAHFATFPPKLVEPCILAGSPKGGIILDPFCGAGTVGLVALRHGRSFIGIEISERYAAIAHRRIQDDLPLFNEFGGVIDAAMAAE